jgi:hypothetical protein
LIKEKKDLIGLDNEHEIDIEKVIYNKEKENINEGHNKVQNNDY